jgi:excisionase family DNA binding protein
MEEKLLYTIKEYAKIMGVNEITVRRWIKKGEVKILRKGKVIRINKDELKASE